MIIAPSASNTAVNYTGAVSPDSLLFYCSSRLRSIDDQVSTQLKKQEQYRSSTQAVNAAQQTFSVGTEGGVTVDGAGGQTREQWYANANAKLDAAIASVPEGSDAYKKLIDVKRQVVSTAADGKFSAEECKSFASALGDIAKELGSSAELDMINLNSLMSQRQTAIQMITNMLSSLNESQKSIAAKMGS